MGVGNAEGAEGGGQDQKRPIGIEYPWLNGSAIQGGWLLVKSSQCVVYWMATIVERTEQRTQRESSVAQLSARLYQELNYDQDARIPSSAHHG